MIGYIILGIVLIVILCYAIYAVFSNKPDGKEMLFGWIIAVITIMITLLINRLLPPK